jgi:BatD DUF11 like domain
MEQRTMTGPIGKLPGIALLLSLLIGSATLHAAVDATVDRQRLALGDTLRLTISATEDDEDVSGVDLSHLEADFEVLQRSTQSNTRIVNGKRTHNRQLIVEIAPRRKGRLTVPAFRVGTGITQAFTVTVSDAPQVDPGNETVLFEAELDRQEVYVQGQLILTLRLQQAINLDRRSISELELDNAFVLPLEQQSFQRTIDGRPWLVHEVRYAIFPEQSGTLEIPAQSFSARESRPRRSLFDSSANGRLIRRSTAALRVTVLPRPLEYPGGATWLPARAVTLKETWSADPATLKAGESVTRTIEIRGAGLQGAQLPPVTPGVTDGLKYFPDQPSIDDSEISSGVLGSRRDSVAIVPTRAGQVTLPEIQVPWWDTQAGELRVATLPALTLDIAPAAASAIDTGAVSASRPDTHSLAPSATADGSPLLWQLIAAGCAIGWLVTLLLLWRNTRRAAPPAGDEKEGLSSRTAYKQLLAVCASNQAVPARAALIRWTAALAGDETLTTLAAVAGVFPDEALQREIDSLERSLFSGSPSEWNGASLATEVKRLHKQAQQRESAQDESLTLYPAS